jgi:type I restriction enzyme R subunit
MTPRQGQVQEMLRALARQARREPTPAEKVLWEMLRDHRCDGLGFRRQTIVGPFRLDFYCPAKKLAVEVDGSIHQEPEVLKRDADRQNILEQEFGIRFIRVGNEDVLKHRSQTLKYILATALLENDLNE